MDPSSEEYPQLSLTLALALLFVWSVMSLGRVYDQRLGEVNDSFTKRFRVIGRLDVTLEALDHLAVDEQAFLSTGDETFQDGVVESIEHLELNIDMLNSLAAKSTSQRARLVELSQSIEQVIGTVGESDRIRDVHGKAAAADFFASKGDEISQAKWQAYEIQIEIIHSISDRIRSADTSPTLLGALLDYPRSPACNSLRLPRG
jgi:methyl-accepting chemotaxis protein